MSKKELYELLGRTYAALCEASEREDLLENMYAEAQETARMLVEENKRLQAIIEKYETEGKETV